MKPLALLLAVCALLAACAADPVLKQSDELLDQGHGEEALALLEHASDAHADNRAYRAEYYRKRDLLLARWFVQAQALRGAAAYEHAARLYRLMLRYDADNPRAKLGLAQIEMDKRHRALLATAGKLLKAGKQHEAQALLAQVLAEDPDQRDARRLQQELGEKAANAALASPQLRISAGNPISLELRDAELRSTFEILSRAANVNFVLDKDVPADQKTSIVVRDAKFEDVLHMLLSANHLQYRALNETTALVFPNTPQGLREHQELAIKSFYISNADVRQTANMLRTILKARDVFVDEKQNLLVIRDTPKTIRYAEHLIAAQDIAEPEVMLDVEVLEVSRSRLLDLGLRYPDTVAWSLVGGNATTSTNSTTGATTTAGTPGVLTLPQWLSRNAGLVQLTFTDPLFLLSLQQQDGSTNLLANPRIRVENHEKANIHIGERVPVITTTAAATGTFLSQNVTYLDIGLKLEVQPTIYLDDDVGIKVGLEVSSITGTIRSPTGGTVTYQIGTRTANTVLRLHDGETQVLGGLINDEDRRNANRVPGLGDLPVLGRLFSATNNSKGKTEVTLLITPHIIRNATRPGARTTEFFAGTDAATGGVSFGAPIGVPAQPVYSPPAPAVPPEMQTPTVGSKMVPFGGIQPPQR